MIKSIMEFLESFKMKVNYTGVKRKKLSCPPGYKVNATGTACEPITGAEKQDHRIASKQAVRTKKQEGQSLQRMTNKKTKKAMKYRKALGLG